MKKEIVIHIFSKTAQLSSPRLLFRKMSRKDAQDMFDYAQRAEVTKYLLWHEHKDLAYTKRYLAYVESCYRAGSFFDFALVDKASGRMIGTCGFTRFDYANDAAEIGYVLHPDYWNKGLATEAVQTIMEYGFNTLGLHRIEAKYMKDNAASRRVMEKCGMQLEGIHHHLMLIKGSYEDIGIYAKIKE